MIHREEFLQLYEKHLKGDCSAEEQKKLRSFCDDVELAPDVWEASGLGEQEVYQRIWQKLEQSRKAKPLKKNRNYSWLKIAALLAFTAGAISWFVKKPLPAQTPVLSRAAKQPQSIRPGKNNAYLTLSNGKQIVLNALQNGHVATQSGIQVTKTKDGMLVYRIDPGKSSPANPLNTAWNTISTPPGGQYQLILADGTKVWLNAASSLSFSAALTGKERRVKLTGEAYFEVVKDTAQPFIVETIQQEIKVLGTHFNVQAYAEDQRVKTSLLEGKVNIASAGKVVSLQAGQEGINTFNGHIQINQAEVAESIAWKNGFFKFTNAGIREVMQQIARWYAIKVTYSGELPVRQFNGTISRQVSIQEVLNMLKYTGVQFKIENNHVTVYQ